MTKLAADYNDLISIGARSFRPNAIRKLTALLTRPVISLAAGAPSPDSFPLNELSETASRIIAQRGATVLQYGTTRGNPELIGQIVSMMSERGASSVSASEILVTTGSQQGLDLMARVLVDRGDVVLVELPSYVGGLIAFHNAGAEFAGVKQDGEGIDVEEVRRKVKQLRAQGRQVRCLYTISSFQNPSGVTLGERRRHELAAAADELDLLIVEDDPYYELHFFQDRPSLLPLVALNPARVVYLSSFSKILAPGLRCAWLRAPAEIASLVELAKEGADLSSSNLDQAIVLDALRSGLIRQRLPQLRKFYADRCAAMLAALDKHASGTCHWNRPLGGFFVWLELPRQLDTAQLLPEAIERGVAYVPGEAFCVDESGRNAMRLAFSKEPAERIAEGIRILCELIGDKLASQS